MDTYATQFFNGHLFVKIGDDLWIIDTGAPTSFGDPDILTIGTLEFSVASDFMGMNASALVEFIDHPVAGLLGMDVLGKFDLLIDAPRSRLVLSTETLDLQGAAISCDSVSGIPTVDVQIDGHFNNWFFDTGAQVSYWQDDSIANYPDAGDITDFFPSFGEFTTQTHHVTISLAGSAFSFRCGSLPGLLGMSLSMAGVNGILGSEILKGRVTGFFPRRNQLVLGVAETASGSLPHSSWAKWYDFAYEHSFGAFYTQLTDLTIRKITDIVDAPAQVVDFGAGTGRLAIPMGLEGYSVTAVEPCPGMLDQLKSKPDSNGINEVLSSMQDFESERKFDLAICVFTVLLYLPNEGELMRALRAAHNALVYGGRLLIDIPSKQIFRSYQHSDPDLEREITITDQGNDVFLYFENTLIHTDDGTSSYTDQFPIRYWPQSTVRDLLDKAGFSLVSDLSDHFTGSGCQYWLMEKRRG
jgi:SAM-dependent methyltransferase